MGFSQSNTGGTFQELRLSSPTYTFSGEMKHDFDFMCGFTFYFKSTK